VTGLDGKKRDATKPKILCPRCSRVGETKDCAACAALRKPASKPEPESKPKAGKPRFDEKLFDKAYGALMRTIDQRGNLMGKGPNYKRCVDLMGMVIDSYAKWKKETA
jgi:hypothetical protein